MKISPHFPEVVNTSVTPDTILVFANKKDATKAYYSGLDLEYCAGPSFKEVKGGISLVLLENGVHRLAKRSDWSF
jgi:hypothetical protein